VLVGFFNDFIMGPSWAAAQDIGRRYSAIVSGTMNMVGNLGAVLGIQVTGRILRDYTPDGSSTPDAAGYTVVFTVYAVVYALGVVLWLLIDASKPLPTEEGPDAEFQEDYREPDNPRRVVLRARSGRPAVKLSRIRVTREGRCVRPASDDRGRRPGRPGPVVRDDRDQPVPLRHR